MELSTEWALLIVTLLLAIFIGIDHRRRYWRRVSDHVDRENFTVRDALREANHEIYRLRQRTGPEGMAVTERTLRNIRQRELLAWAADTWGPVTLQRSERALRLLEEAIEYAQAVGADQVKMAKVFTMVLAKEPGEPFQELGGVALTLAAACEVEGVMLYDAEKIEIARCYAGDKAKFRAKHDAKVVMGAAG